MNVDVRLYLKDLYETYWTFTKEIIKAKRYHPQLIALGLYNVLGVNLKYEGHIAYGPLRIGKIDLTEIGFRGYVDTYEFDPYDAGLILNEITRTLSDVLGIDFLMYNAKRIGRRMAHKYDDPEDLSYDLERQLENTLYGPHIVFYESIDSLHVYLEYNIPLAKVSEMVGSMFVYSLAYAREKAYGYKLVEKYHNSEDEYELESVFEII